MDKIKLLNVRRLLKELDFIEIDFEYRKEVVSEADTEFIKSIDDFLSLNPELKEIYDKKLNEKLNSSIKSKVDEMSQSQQDDENKTDHQIDSEDEAKIDEEINQDVEEVSPLLKRLYRDIVKLTHPDRVKKKSLNEIYIRATEYYDKRDKIGLYKICTELGIEYQLEDSDEELISFKIEDYKKKINFLESTFTWKWKNCQDDAERNQILMNYIKIRIS